MSTETRDLALGTVLTVTTGRYLAESVDDLYDLLGWMTDDKPFTHQLGRFATECAPVLLDQHPDLGRVTVPEDLDGPERCRAWLAKQAALLGFDRLAVGAGSAKDRHECINPLIELIDKRKAAR
jgi:hypothetical protein